MTRDGTVNLLWTGGWDSTFRLLELVLGHRRRVQPYYLITTLRRSSLRELEAMREIRRGMERVRRGAADLVAASVIVADHDLHPDATIAGRYNRLRQHAHLGAQYEWLARLAQQFDVRDLELSVHVDDKAAVFLDERVRAVDDGTDRGTWELNEEARATDMALFQCFRFPLLRLSKVEMQEIAHAHGFDAVLEQTWFCHSPRLGLPCGMCLPCQFAQEEGMARRIPRVRRSWPYRAAWKTGKAVQSLVLRVADR